MNFKYISETALTRLLNEVEAQDLADALRRQDIYTPDQDKASWVDGFDWRKGGKQYPDFSEHEKIALYTEKFIRDGGYIDRVARGASSADSIVKNVPSTFVENDDADEMDIVLDDFSPGTDSGYYGSESRPDGSSW